MQIVINSDDTTHGLIPSGGVRNYTSVENKTVAKYFDEYPLVKAFLAGSLSGTCSTILFQPLDLVKTRLQNTHTTLVNGRNVNSVGMVAIFSNILQQEHIKGLWKGMTPSITRTVPGVGLYFCSLDFIKTNFYNDKSPTAIESLMMGMVARCMAGTVLIPVTVVKTRFESGVYGYNSVISALKEIYKTEGIKGMTSGLVPTLFRDAPFSGLYLMFYSQTKKIIPPDILNSDYASPLHFSCGVTAGVLASLVTQPADVIKTKMQLYPKKFNGVYSVIIYVHNKYGIRGYFKGTVPRMLRRTLMAAMAWTMYERISKVMGLK